MKIRNQKSNFKALLLATFMTFIFVSCENNQQKMFLGNWKEVSNDFVCSDKSTESSLNNSSRINNYAGYEFNEDGKVIVTFNGVQSIHSFEFKSDTLTIFFEENGNYMKYDVESFSKEKLILKTTDASKGCILTSVLEK
jgi:hypothetical protein